MEKQEIMERILESLHISDSQVDLVGRVLNLEKDKKRVYAVNLYLNHPTLVYLHEDFSSLREFRDYLKENELPSERAHTGRTWRTCDGYYWLAKEGLNFRFVGIDYLPKKSEQGEKIMPI